MKYKLLSFYLFIFLSFPPIAQTVTELEPVGTRHPVIEQDIRIEMKTKSAEQWELYKNGYLEKAQKYQPDNLQQLPRAQSNRSFTVDMTYTLDRDLTGDDGKTFYPKGYQFNPLDYMNFTIGLVVIDGADHDQVNWFKQSPYASNHKMKLLLSGGYTQSLVQELDRAVFYLDKEVAGRFHLAAVPCVAMQRDKHIQVTEFYIWEKQK